MSAGAATAWFFVAVLVLVGIAVGATIVRADRQYMREMPTTRLRPVRHHAVRELPPVWPCARPQRPLTIPQAKRVMQDHMTHSLDTCPRKRQAHALLVFAGRIVPEGRAHR